MSTTLKLELGTLTTVLTTTNLSALANNALYLSGAYNNTQGNTGDGWPMARVTVAIEMNVAAAANTGVAIWFLKSDGTNTEAGGTSYTPLRNPDLTAPAPVDTTQRIQQFDVPIPVGNFYVLIKNNGTGQAFKTDTGGTGSFVAMTPITSQQI